MPDPSFKTRVWITAILLAAAFALLHGVSHGEGRALRQSLSGFPEQLDDWQGQDSPLEPRIVKVLGVDDYLSRVYTNREGQAMGLYIGYYNSQRTGDTIHSPKNCLPGAGWEPVQSGLLTIDLADGTKITVNDYLIQKGLDRQLALYWYQGRGRVVASEYWGKVWLVTDAITRNRTDGALIRVVTPLAGSEADTRARALGFVRVLYPHLGEFIPN